MPNIDLSILNQRQTPAFYADVFANRPAAGFVGRIFVSTNTFAFYRDNGTGWDLIGGPGTGTITGSGASGQIALWDGASTITGDTGLTYNGTDNSLTASKFIVTGGTSSQFLKGDGSLDSNTYNTGSGAASQVAFFSGTNAITGENNLWWDSVNNHFGINTNVPGTAADIHHDQSTILQLNQTVATNDTRIAFQNSGAALWRIGNFYNAGANDWGIFDVVGSIQPITVKKTTGQVLIGTSTVGSGKLVVASSNSDNGVQIVGAAAPSLRIDNAESGPTKRVGLGISTATNNFIQGSVDRDFCIFNGSTTASPMLFGIYGTTNVVEAARISSTLNLLVGTTSDNGRKLQINGDASFATNGLFGGSNNPGNAGSYTVSVGVPGTTAGGIQLWAATNQSSFLQFGDGAASADNYRGYVSYNHNTDTLSLGAASVDRLTIASTGAATFSSNVSVNGLATSANYKLGGSGNAYFSGSNDKGIFITDNNSPAYASIVGLNSAISSYNNFEMRASGTDGQLYLTTSGNVLVNSRTDNGNRLQVQGDSYVNGLGTFTGANLQAGNQYLRSANVALPHSSTTTVLRFFNNAGNLSGQNAIFGIINIFVGWNAGYNFGSNIYTYSISCSSNGIGVLTLLSSNVVGSSLVTSITASADGTGCKIDITTNGTSNPLNANSWITFTGNFF